MTEEEEVVSFKQKLAFGCKVKKIPNHTKMGMQQFHTITLRTKGAGSLLKLTWDSHKSDQSILVADIEDVIVDNTKTNSGDRGKYFTIRTKQRHLHLVASSAKESFWFIKGFHGLIEEASEKRSSKKLKELDLNSNYYRESTVDSDLANELFASSEGGSDHEEELLEKGDIDEIIKNVELTGEVRLTRGKSLTKDELQSVR